MLRIAFSRTAIIVVALLLQLFVFFASFYWLKDYSTVVYAAFVLLGAVTVVHILNEENNASFKIAWIIPVLVIPVFGTVLYIYINLQPGTKRIHKKLTKIKSVRILRRMKKQCRSYRSSPREKKALRIICIMRIITRSMQAVK